jgi:endonuclease/exonuclease/phosphatase (EEP) superfamily protein YafD
MPHTALSLLTWLTFLIAAVGLAARFVPVFDHTVLFISALSPYLLIFAGTPAVLLLLNTRSRWARVLALVLAAGVVVTVIPRFIGSARPAPGSVPVRVLTANLWEGAANPDELTAIARERADIILVQELTTDCATGLRGLESDFPYQAVDARPGATGVGIWSRYPIHGARRDSRYRLGALVANVQVPGAASDTLVLSVHLAGPWPYPINDWRADVAKLPDTLRAAADRAGPGSVVAAGDFNATTDMLPFRRLLRNGYQNASQQAGAGFAPTYPANRQVPPLIGIDHILTFNSTASDVRTVRIPGSDHLGVVATIHIPGRTPGE